MVHLNVFKLLEISGEKNNPSVSGNMKFKLMLTQGSLGFCVLDPCTLPVKSQILGESLRVQTTNHKSI